MVGLKLPLVAACFCAIPLVPVHCADPLRPTPAQIKQLDEVLVEMRKLMPMRIDKDTEIVEVSRNNLSLFYVLRYQLKGRVITANDRGKLTGMAVDSVCREADLREILEYGFSIIYQAHDERGLPVNHSYIDKATCRGRLDGR